MTYVNAVTIVINKSAKNDKGRTQNVNAVGEFGDQKCEESNKGMSGYTTLHRWLE